MGELIAGGPYEKQNYVYERITDYINDIFVGVAKAKFLPNCGSSIHFYGTSLVALGRLRYYSAMQTLIGMAPGHKGSASVLEINESADKINCANIEATSHVSVGRSSAQSIPNCAWTKILFSTETYDTLNEFASSRFTATKAGYYHVSGGCMGAAAAWSDGEFWIVRISKNGGDTMRGSTDAGSISSTATSYKTSVISGTVYLAVGNYIELHVFHNQGAALNTVAGIQFCYMTIDRTI